MGIKNEPGSYKDPSGGIFYYRDEVCRWVSSDTSQFYQDLVKSDLFKDLVQSNCFIPTSLIDLSGDEELSKKYDNNATYFKHERIEFISFPYEWPVSMIIDAAIHTLDLHIRLLQNNLTLKDATPYNIQFVGTQPVFIDLCSIENASKNGIWYAYNQFCQMFLYPLLIFIYKRCIPGDVYRTRMAGLTLDETVQHLGLHPFWRYRAVLDYLIPALVVKAKYFKLDVTKKKLSISRTFKNSAEIQLHTARRLRKLLGKLHLKTGAGKWINYTKSCSYSDEDYLLKQKFVETLLHAHPVKNVLDLGCNIGDFPIIAAKNGCNVVALDIDLDCVDSLYRNSKANNYNILSLCMDITNPSPSLGWLNTERPSFLNRINGHFDCVFALALVHHLVVTHRICFTELAHLFQHCTSRFLIVEYVGPSDMMFQELLRYRTESFNDLSMSTFEGAMLTHFSILKKQELIDKQKSMERCLYIMERC